jgi:hypothetical protein
MIDSTGNFQDNSISIKYLSVFTPIIYMKMDQSHLYDKPVTRGDNEPKSSLYLSLEQVCDHLPASDPRSSPQRREIESAGEGIRVTEEEHGWNPATGIFQREARLIHLILLHLATAEVVDATLRVDLGFVGSRNIGKLSTLKDVEVVIGGVSAGVTFGANCGS